MNQGQPFQQTLDFKSGLPVHDVNPIFTGLSITHNLGPAKFDLSQMGAPSNLPANEEKDKRVILRSTKGKELIQTKELEKVFDKLQMLSNKIPNLDFNTLKQEAIDNYFSIRYLNKSEDATPEQLSKIYLNTIGKCIYNLLVSKLPTPVAGIQLDTLKAVFQQNIINIREFEKNYSVMIETYGYFVANYKRLTYKESDYSDFGNHCIKLLES